MNFINFLRKEAERPLQSIVLMTILAGLSSAILLGIINAAVKTANIEEVSFNNLLLFIVTLVAFIVTEKYMLKYGVVIIEEVLGRVRNRLSKKILQADLLTLDRIGSSEIYNRMSSETAIISRSAGILVASMQSLVMIIFVLFYIATLSLLAFGLVLGLLTLAIYLYLTNQKKIKSELNQTNQKEVQFLNALTDMLHGIKELKFNFLRTEDLKHDVLDISSSLKELKFSLNRKYDNNYIFAQTFFYILIASIIFLLPKYGITFSDTITQIVTAILFIIGPISNVVMVVQIYNEVDIASQNIVKLEQRLDETLDFETGMADIPEIKFRNNIELQDIEFQYYGENGNQIFGIGPMNLKINQGEIIFIVGGNGSGKTTLMKVLSRLYNPSKGKIFIDGLEVTSSLMPSYRQLFSSVFNDFHLFVKLYGFRDISFERVYELLRQMDLSNKTEFLKDKFSNLNLSTGQRKRLALVISILEDKPIYLFDEWAADQDFNFRECFYKEILQQMKKNGKTIIVITHDERYFHIADKVIKLELGKIL